MVCGAQRRFLGVPTTDLRVPERRVASYTDAFAEAGLSFLLRAPIASDSDV
jgi:hypothetical protein